MNFILDKDSFYVENLYFSEIKHNIIIDGKFTKLFYSTPFFLLNNIFIDLKIVTKDLREINSLYHNKYYGSYSAYYNSISNNSGKYIMYFDMTENKETLEKMIEIEKNILDYYSLYRGINKIPEYIFKNQIMNKNLKFYKNMYSDENSTNFYLKISGIWENNSQIGITYKIVNYS